MKTHIVHCQKDYYDVYIGRPSKWGNPFSHLSDTLAEFRVHSRNEAIEKYKDWLLFGEGQYLLKDLSELEGKILGCWCKPKRCHGEVLASIIDAKAVKASDLLF